MDNCTKSFFYIPERDVFFLGQSFVGDTYNVIYDVWYGGGEQKGFILNYCI